MAREISQFFSVMNADRFEGLYTFVHKMYKPLEMDSGDFCLHVDEETKNAYIWFKRPHFQLVCATLSEEYTEVTNEYKAGCEHPTGVSAKWYSSQSSLRFNSRCKMLSANLAQASLWHDDGAFLAKWWQ